MSLIVNQEGNIPVVGGKQGSLVELALFCEIRYLISSSPRVVDTSEYGLKICCSKLFDDPRWQRVFESAEVQ